MAAPASPTHDVVEPHAPPRLPEIQDEAADTPLWVPALGLTLFVVVALWLVIGAAFRDAAVDEAPALEAPAVAAEPAAPAEAH